MTCHRSSASSSSGGNEDSDEGLDGVVVVEFTREYAQPPADPRDQLNNAP